jgi:hypothetical protein
MLIASHDEQIRIPRLLPRTLEQLDLSRTMATTPKEFFSDNIGASGRSVKTGTAITERDVGRQVTL